MDNDNTTTTINKLVEIFKLKEIAEIIHSTAINHRVRKFKLDKFLMANIFAQVTGISSIRELSSRIADDEELQNFLGLDSISASQISRKQNSLPSAIFEEIFFAISSVVLNLRKGTDLSGKIKPLCAIDATVMTLAMGEYKWATYRSTKAGIKLHLSVVVTDEIVVPNRAVITKASLSDRSQMEELVEVDSDAIYLFDRGYNDYGQFDRFCEEGLRFVTRLKKNATIEKTSEQKSDFLNHIYQDVDVFLGKQASGTKMKYQLRMIETKDQEGNDVTIITNCFDQSAKEIADLYRYRWKIETFFKFMKQNMKIKKFFGKGQNAVFTQIWIALITYCLEMYLKLKHGYKGTLLDLKRKLNTFLFQDVAKFIKSLASKLTKKSKGRRKVDCEQDYQEVLNDFECGNTVGYSDWTIDNELFL